MVVGSNPSAATKDVFNAAWELARENSQHLLLIYVADMTRALNFYQNAMGLKRRFESPAWSELTWGDATVALHAGGKGDADTGLGFQVDDLAGACEMVKAHGGKIVRPPEDRPGEPIRLAIVADTEGNRFSLTENVA